ncbi:MAG: hypothetical protein WCW17_01405 [Patescibacteria group bacterium]
MAQKQSSTQQHLDIAEIRDELVILKTGDFRAVLLVSSVNFALKSEREQNALIFSYQGFLNSLEFPIQIIVRSKKLDLTPYINQLKKKLEAEENELMSIQIADYIEYVQRLINIANIMDKQFFVVVPYSPPVLNKPGGGLFSGLFGNKSQQTINIDEKQLLQYKSLITERTGVIVSGLASLGLRAAMLSTQELVELFYEIYNPEESSEEKLADVNVLESALISTKEGENATTK